MITLELTKEFLTYKKTMSRYCDHWVIDKIFDSNNSEYPSIVICKYVDKLGYNQFINVYIKEEDLKDWMVIRREQIITDLITNDILESLN